ncbi:hypothetical protein [Microbulbifer spongiae]|nr:hypothetical protein [Microbulbifer sp. MI-G]
MSAIADNRIDALVHQVEVTDERVYRMLNLIVAMRTWESNPGET